MHVIPFAIFGLILLVAAAVVAGCLYYAFRARAKITAIREAPLCDVADLDEGYAKAVGRVVALEDPLDSPLKDTPCVFFHFKVEEQRTRTVTEHDHGSRPGSFNRTRTRTETYWATVLDDRQAVRCGVEDRTGVAQVELLEAETVLSPSGHTTSGLLSGCPAAVRRELSERYNFSTKGLLFNKTLRYTETVIEEGDKLFVIGEIEVSRQGRPTFVKGGQPFIVSDRSETKLLGHYRRRATWAVVAVLAAGLLGPALATVVLVIGSRVAARPRVVGNPLLPQFVGPVQGVLDPPRPPNPVAAPPTGPDFLTRAVANDIDRELANLRSPDLATRRRGAGMLSVLPAEPARRDEVLTALRAVANDPDFHLRTAAQQGLRRWEAAAAQGVGRR